MNVKRLKDRLFTGSRFYLSFCHIYAIFARTLDTSVIAVIHLCASFLLFFGCRSSSYFDSFPLMEMELSWRHYEKSQFLCAPLIIRFLGLSWAFFCLLLVWDWWFVCVAYVRFHCWWGFPQDISMVAPFSLTSKHNNSACVDVFPSPIWQKTISLSRLRFTAAQPSSALRLMGISALKGELWTTEKTLTLTKGSFSFTD